MSTVFIISEYNPFHNGHAHQIKRIREELRPDAVVSIMSGNFTQRGAPAIADKFRRARLAVLCGCDLVVELPAVYATSSAEFFARGGVALAAALDNQGILSFGSESGELSKIITAARLLLNETDAIDAALRQGLDENLTYAGARSQAISKLMSRQGDPLNPSSPNDILAVEYVRASLGLGKDLKFHTVRRLGMGYHETSKAEGGSLYPSASFLRKEFKEGRMDSVVSGIPAKGQPYFEQDMRQHLLLEEDLLRQLILYRLGLFPGALDCLPEAGGGLGERILSLRQELASSSLDGFILKVKTRRFTYTRIRRLLLHLALGFDELDYAARRKSVPPYARILALNGTGQQFLARTRKTRQIPVIQSAKDVPAKDFRPDLSASRLYSLLNPAYADDADFTHRLRVVSDSF